MSFLGDMVNVKVWMTPKGGMVESGGEQDRFRSLNVKILIKTFKWIPNMAIFRGRALVTPLGARARTGGE